MELHLSHLLSAVLCYIFVKAGINFLRSCTYQVGAVLQCRSKGNISGGAHASAGGVSH